MPAESRDGRRSLRGGVTVTAELPNYPNNNSNYANLLHASHACFRKHKDVFVPREESHWRWGQIRVIRVVIRVIRQFGSGPATRTSMLRAPCLINQLSELLQRLQRRHRVRVERPQSLHDGVRSRKE
jgi:hypothetical protein